MRRQKSIYGEMKDEMIRRKEMDAQAAKERRERRSAQRRSASRERSLSRPDSRNSRNLSTGDLSSAGSERSAGRKTGNFAVASVNHLEVGHDTLNRSQIGTKLCICLPCPWGFQIGATIFVTWILCSWMRVLSIKENQLALVHKKHKATCPFKFHFSRSLPSWHSSSASWRGGSPPSTWTSRCPRCPDKSLASSTT